MAARARRCPSVRRSGRGAAADESVVSSEPRICRRLSTATTPLLASAATADVAPGMVAESSATRCGPWRRASITARWREAVLAGTKSFAAGVRLAQRASTAPARSVWSSQGAPSEARVTRTFCPGARNGRTASQSGHAYSRAIHAATRAAASSKAGGARTWSTGWTRPSDTPSGGSSETAST